MTTDEQHRRRARRCYLYAAFLMGMSGKRLPEAEWVWGYMHDTPEDLVDRENGLRATMHQRFERELEKASRRRNWGLRLGEKCEFSPDYGH